MSWANSAQRIYASVLKEHRKKAIDIGKVVKILIRVHKRVSEADWVESYIPGRKVDWFKSISYWNYRFEGHPYLGVFRPYWTTFSLIVAHHVVSLSV